MSDFYNINSIVNKKDLDGYPPEVFLIDGNRTGGKTTEMGRYLFSEWKKGNGEFIYIVRNIVDVKGASEYFFNFVENLYFPDDEIGEDKIINGCYRWTLNGEQCGFCVALNAVVKLKKMRGLFFNVNRLFMDEYQDENGRYLTDETQKMQSLHTTVASGQGKQSRYVPLFMCSNTVSVLNPYYTRFGIAKRLKKDTKFLRGHGWILQLFLSESAKNQAKDSRFNVAFGGRYLDYASENVYLNDNENLIEKPSGYTQYQCSVKYNGEWYSFRLHSGICYACQGADLSFPRSFSFSVSDMDGSRTAIGGDADFMRMYLRNYFVSGNMRFDSVQSKNMALDFLGYL